MSVLIKAISATFLAFAPFSAFAASFTVLEAGTPNVLGTFDAPSTGGAVASGSFSVDGGVFDVLAAPPQDPVFDQANNWLVGGGSSFGAFVNSIAYNTVDVNSSAITCGVGECVLSFTTSGGETPPEWYLDFIPANPNDAAAIDFGFYEISPAPIPLPAAAWLLLAGLGTLGVIGRQRRSSA